MPDIPERLSAALADRYALERPLGTGGMATVYLARDLRHDRQVAIKVLKPDLAAVLGAERFVAEIKTTAALQHPHILPLFDSGEAGGFLWYAMPYIEGETLRTRLDREHQLGVDEAVGITTAVADALDYAHRHGVIHRDIKPENILLHDGRPMVADFGIALAVSAAAGGRMTETGLSLGTPHYMSPEQATADKEISGRSDIYSLGSVCYEMLTGDPPHTGSSAQQIIMKIVTEEAAPVTKVRKSVPAHVAAAVGKAIEKLPADRFASAREFAEALTNPAFRTASTPGGPAGPVRPSDRPSVRLTAALAALALLATLAAAWGWLRTPGAPDAARRLDLIAFPDSLAPVASFVAETMSLSPDGRTLVYMMNEGTGRLAVRDPDKLEPRILAGTESARWPQVSPDGKSVLFVRAPFLSGSLEIVPITGGASRVLVRDSVFIGASWGPDGSVYYSQRGGILRLPPGGGAPEVVAARTEAWSWFRPLAVEGGLLASKATTSSDVRPILHAIPRNGGDPRPLTEGMALQFLEPGVLVLLTNGGPNRALVARFDASSLEFTSDPAPLAPAQSTTGFGWVDLAASRTTLYYRQRARATGALAWVTRAGTARSVDPSWEADGLATPELSPDGRRVALAASQRIVIKQLDDGPAIQVVPTDQSGQTLRPSWRPDGRAVAYFSFSTSDSVRVVRDDGIGAPRPLVNDPRGASDATWTPDGRWIVYRTPVEGPEGADIMLVPSDDSAPPTPLVATPAQETTPTPSPDGRWLAYVSDESGRPEVYVAPFPDVADRRWQVSARGGIQPRWAKGSGELFYVSSDGMMTAARLAPGPDFEIASREELFAVAPFLVAGAFHHDYDVTADGQRFIMVQLGAAGQFVREENWLAAHPELVK